MKSLPNLETRSRTLRGTRPGLWLNVYGKSLNFVPFIAIIRFLYGYTPLSLRNPYKFHSLGHSNKSPCGRLITTTLIRSLVGKPGIEPGPHGPKPRTLPLCYIPREELHIKFILHVTSERRDEGCPCILIPDRKCS